MDTVDNEEPMVFAREPWTTEELLGGRWRQNADNPALIQVELPGGEWLDLITVDQDRELADDVVDMVAFSIVDQHLLSEPAEAARGNRIVAAEMKVAEWRQRTFGPPKEDARYVLRALREMVELAVAAGIPELDFQRVVEEAYGRERNRGTMQPSEAGVLAEAPQVCVCLMGIFERRDMLLVEAIADEGERLHATLPALPSVGEG